MPTLDVGDAITQLAALLDRARAGEETVLAKAGKAYAKLVPIDPPPQPIDALAG